MPTKKHSEEFEFFLRKSSTVALSRGQYFFYSEQNFAHSNKIITTNQSNSTALAQKNSSEFLLVGID